MVSRLPPLRSLQTFEAVGRIGSIGGAARELGVSPGAVTQQIHLLEADLGLQLVERAGRGVALTTWGRRFHRRIAGAFAELREARDDIDRARRSGNLTVSALSSVAARWLGPKLYDWQAAHPDSLVHVHGTEGEPVFGDGTVDFRISYGDRVSGYERSAALFTDWVVPVAAPGLVGTTPLSDPRDILRCPLFGIDWEPYFKSPPSWSQWFRGLGIDTGPLKMALTFSLSAQAIDEAIAGRGVVLAQCSMIGGEVAAGRWRWCIHTGCAWRSRISSPGTGRRWTSPAAATFATGCWVSPVSMPPRRRAGGKGHNTAAPMNGRGRPHPEEGARAPVSKDEAAPRPSRRPVPGLLRVRAERGRFIRAMV
ncbi:LysR family transcriptional regulator [Methylobrevis pamukkalensis]|uniref:Glycine cleavage system transcriptional activator n=1 Tax=Methylobrevis pamukkalensis TaxID=1439726 RepID=A0A1E3H7T9_9HYPH|nr:LysR family transcriptional regulator [Methylobrevis pamukkalensis]ODN72397.1 Glycine cleavage system transcriptional activator [Methylobrevis pamukkalensis]